MTKASRTKRNTYSVDEVAKILEASRLDIFKLIYNRALPAYIEKDRLRIPVTDVLKILEEKEVANSEPN